MKASSFESGTDGTERPGDTTIRAGAAGALDIACTSYFIYSLRYISPVPYFGDSTERPRGFDAIRSGT